MVSTEGHRRLEVGEEHQHQSRGQTGSKHKSVWQSKRGGPLGVGGATAGDAGSGSKEGGVGTRAAGVLIPQTVSVSPGRTSEMS